MRQDQERDENRPSTNPIVESEWSDPIIESEWSDPIVESEWTEPSPEKKSPIGSSTQGLQGLGGSSGGNLPSPLSASATPPETPFIGAGRLESIKESTEPKPAPKKGLVVPPTPVVGLGGEFNSEDFTKNILENAVNNPITRTAAEDIKSGDFIVDGKAVSRYALKQKMFDRDYVARVNRALEDGSYQHNPILRIGEGVDSKFKEFVNNQIQSQGESDELKSLHSGLYALRAGIVNTPVYLNEIMEEATGVENAFFRTFMSVSPDMAQMASSGEAKERLKKYSEELMRASEKATSEKFQIAQPDQQPDFIDLFNRGEYGELGRMAVNTTIESGPVMASAAAASAITGSPVAGAMFLVPLSASQEGTRMRISDDPKIKALDESDRLARMNMFGLAEGIPEALMGPVINRSFKLARTGIQETVKAAFQRGGREAAIDVAEGAAKETAFQIVKNYTKDNAFGFLEEFTTTIATELTDSYLGVSDKSFGQIMRSALNDGAIGAVSQAGIGATGTSIALGNKAIESGKKVFDKKASFTAGLDDLNEYATQFSQRTGQSEETIKENIAKRAKAANAVPRDLIRDTRTVDLVEEKQQLTVELKALDDAFKAPVQEKIDKINAEIARRSERNEYLKKREAQGIEPEVMGDVPIVVAAAITRVEMDKPTTLNQLEEASTWLYGEYKRIQEMRNDGDSPISEGRIADYLENLGKDIEMLETAKGKLLEKGNVNDPVINSTPTDEKYATVNEGGGVQDMTKQEYLDWKANAVDVKTPAIKIPAITGSIRNPFDERLTKLGYADSDIAKMTMEQKQEIVINNRNAPVVESSSKVDAIKENAKQERLAEMQRGLDDEIEPTNEAPKQDGENIPDGLPPREQSEGIEGGGTNETQSDVAEGVQSTDTPVGNTDGVSEFEVVRNKDTPLGKSYSIRNKETGEISSIAFSSEIQAQKQIESLNSKPVETEETVSKKEDSDTDELLSGEAQARRDKGEYTKDGVTHKRNKEDKGQKGSKGTVRFTQKVEVPFTYKLVEAESLQPSHMNGRRNPEHFLPEAQPKSRNDDGSIAMEDAIAKDPRLDLVSGDTDAYGGAPIVNSRNEVVQGNNRSAGLKKGYANGNPKYKEQLAAEAESFGFTKEQVEGMKNPVLVREVAGTDQFSIELGNYDVKDLESGGKSGIDPIATARRIPVSDKARITQMLFGDGKATLRNAIRDGYSKLSEMLSPYVNESQKNSLRTEAPSAKTLMDIEALVRQFLFDGGDPNLSQMFDGLSARQQAAIDKSMPQIFSTGMENSLASDVQNAIIALSSFQLSGVRDFASWVNQGDVFNNGKRPSDIFTQTEIEIAKILSETSNESDLREKFSQYATLVNGTEGNLFAEAVKPISKEDAIGQVFPKTGNSESRTEKADRKKEATPKKPKPTAAPKGKPVAEKTARESKKDDLAAQIKALEEDLWNDLNKMGIAFDPKKEGKEAREFTDKLVVLAKLKIQQFGMNLEDFIKDVVANYKGKRTDVEERAREAYAEAKGGKKKRKSKEQNAKERAEKASEPSQKKKAIVNRGVEGEVSEGIKAALEETGLYYVTESQKDAEAVAQAFLDKVGFDNALRAIRTGEITGAPKAMLWGRLIDEVGMELAEETDPDKIRALERIEAELVDEFGVEAKVMGQFISAIQHVLENSDFGYKLSTQKKRYKDANGGVLEPEVEAKFVEYDKQLRAVKERLLEALKRAKEAEDKIILENIKADSDRAKVSSPMTAERRRSTDKALSIIRNIRANIKANNYSDATGIVAAVDLGLLAIEKSIEAGVSIAESIEVGIKEINRLLNGKEWKEDKFRKDVTKEYERNGMETFSQEDNTSGGIPKNLIRQIVEEGVTDIDELTDIVMEELGIENTAENHRQTRDDITGYGKTTNPTTDEISLEISRMKEIGQLISKIEDAEEGLRPKRSGYQRRRDDAATKQKIREMNRQLRELMKGLPMDDANLAKYQKTALDTLKTRLRNRIDDLKAEIESKSKLDRSNKEVEYDAEANELLSEKNALQEAHDEIFKSQGLTDAQRIERAITSLQNTEHDYQKKIDTKQFTPTERKPLPDDPRLVEQRRLTAEKKAEFEAKKLQFDPSHPSVKATATALKALETQLKKLEAQIAAGILETQKKESLVQQTAAIKIAKERLAEKRAFLRELQEQAGIPERKRLEAIKEASRNRIAVMKERMRTGNFAKGRYKAKNGVVSTFVEATQKTELIDEEVTRLKMEEIRIKELFDIEVYRAELAQRKWYESLGDFAVEMSGLTRALMATGEMSALLVQGGKMAYSHPMLAAKGFKEMWKHFASEKRAADFIHAVKASDMYPELKSVGLAITDSTHEGKLLAAEEAFVGGYVRHIWNHVLGIPAKVLDKFIPGGSRAYTPIDWVKATITGDYIAPQKAFDRWQALNPNEAFSRAQSGLLNTVRLGRYMQGRDMLLAQGKTFQSHPEEFKRVAEYVNRATGRAGLGKAEFLAKPLSVLLFSARNWVSILNDTTPLGLMTLARAGNWSEGSINVPLRNKSIPFPYTNPFKPTVAQKMAVTDYLKWIGGMAAMVTLGKIAASALSGDDEDDERPVLETDPTSSNFMKPRIGNTYIDIFSGRQQMAVLQARMLSNSIKSGSSGKKYNLGQTSFTPTRLGLLERVVRGKSTPTFSMLYKYLDKRTDEDGVDRDEFGEPFDGQQLLIDNSYPMWWGTISELHKEQPELVAYGLDGLSFFGMGVQSYGSKNPSDPAIRKVRANEEKVKAAKETEIDSLLNTIPKEKSDSLISEMDVATILDINKLIAFDERFGDDPISEIRDRHNVNALKSTDPDGLYEIAVSKNGKAIASGPKIAENYYKAYPDKTTIAEKDLKKLQTILSAEKFENMMEKFNAIQEAKSQPK